MPISQQEEKLVFAAQHGNTACFEELYKLYYEKIYALAQTMLKNSADAEDALQLTFVSAWKNLERLENPAAFSTWLQRITVNQCNSMLRRRRPAASIDDESEDGEVMQIEDDLMLPEQYAERDDLSYRLQKIINDLSDVQRETVMLYYFNEMTVEEIAEIMDCSVGTVKSRLFLARKALKTEIEEQERKTGEKFYGVALIPFGAVFVGQVIRNMISKNAAMNIFQNISASLFGTPFTPQTPQSAPAQGGQPMRPAARHASSVPRRAATAAAKHGARHVAASATKAAFPLWAKIVSGVLAVALIAAGGVVGWNAINNLSDNHQSEPTELSAIVQDASTASETAAPTEAPTIVDVDPESMPQSLDAFLIELNYGSTLPGHDVREYDYLDPGETYDTLASVIVGNPSCVDSDIYPGEKTQKLWENNSDPLGKFNNKGGTIIFDETKLLWIMNNIFNLSAETSRDMLNAALEKDEDMYEYEQNGKMYVYKMQLGLGKPGYYITYKQVRFDGERYYFIYDVASGYGSEENAPFMDTETFYAEMAEKEIDGKKYWTMYRHSATIPELPAVTGADADTPDEEPETQAPDTVDWSSMYYEYLTETEKPVIWADSAYEIRSSHPLGLHDFDLDGIPELIIGVPGARLGLSVFTIDNGEVINAGCIGGKNSFYSDDPAYHGIFRSDTVKAGEEGGVSYSQLLDGKIVTTSVFEFKYNRNTKSFDYTINDETLCDVYLDCTTEYSDPAYRELKMRGPKNQLKLSNWGEVQSNGWESFISRYGY